MRKSIVVVMVVLVAGFAQLASAAPPKKAWYIGLTVSPEVEWDDATLTRVTPESTTPGLLPFEFPFPGLEWLGSTTTPEEFTQGEVQYDSGMAYGAVLGYQFTRLIRAELEYRDMEADIDAIDQFRVKGQSAATAGFLNVWFDFNRGGYIQPYIGAGVGRAHVSFGDASDTVLIGQAGLGLNLAVTDHLAIDIGYRKFDAETAMFSVGDNTDFELDTRGEMSMLTLKYTAVAPKAYRPADADGDGVSDPNDHCPGTPKGAVVDQNGCSDSDGDGVFDLTDACPDTAPGLSVDRRGCADADGDGVLDRHDECPGTPAGVMVNDKGCRDADGDGVKDTLDQCPGTPTGVTVLANGCSSQQSLILQGVSFETGKAVLTPAAKALLTTTATALAEHADVAIELHGHTDSVGNAEANMALSLRRAASVRRHLAAKGYPADRITIEGFGESKPVADNATPEGRAMNRRVEIHFRTGNTE